MGSSFGTQGGSDHTGGPGPRRRPRPGPGAAGAPLPFRPCACALGSSPNPGTFLRGLRGREVRWSCGQQGHRGGRVPCTSFPPASVSPSRHEDTLFQNKIQETDLLGKVRRSQEVAILFTAPHPRPFHLVGNCGAQLQTNSEKVNDAHGVVSRGIQDQLNLKWALRPLCVRLGFHLL